MAPIRFLQRPELDLPKWNGCITQAANGLVYAYSDYLDAMAGQWGALVCGDYQYVMPLPWRKKWGIPYFYQPAFTAQLGIFGNGISEALVERFLQALLDNFRFGDQSLNHANDFPAKTVAFRQRANFVLPLQPDYATLQKGYRENIRRNLRKSVQYGCTVQKDVPVEAVIRLAREQRQPGVTDEDHERFRGLFHGLQQQQRAVTYGIGQGEQLLASCVFFFSHRRAYYILVGNHPNGRTLGASHALIDAFIRDHAGTDLLLDFEGSDLRNLAFFYSSFGAREEHYPAFHLNRLPWWLRWAKK